MAAAKAVGRDKAYSSFVDDLTETFNLTIYANITTIETLAKELKA